MHDVLDLPIITDDSGDIGVYRTVADACINMEAIDVRDGVYDVFDRSGRRLLVTASSEAVSIQLDPRAEPEPEELERRLRHFITRVGADRVGIPDLQAAALSDLVDALDIFFHRGRRRSER
jgi:hypothetical protein